MAEEKIEDTEEGGGTPPEENPIVINPEKSTVSPATLSALTGEDKTITITVIGTDDLPYKGIKEITPTNKDIIVKSMKEENDKYTLVVNSTKVGDNTTQFISEDVTFGNLKMTISLPVVIDPITSKAVPNNGTIDKGKDFTVKLTVLGNDGKFFKGLKNITATNSKVTIKSQKENASDYELVITSSDLGNNITKFKANNVEFGDFTLIVEKTLKELVIEKNLEVANSFPTSKELKDYNDFVNQDQVIDNVLYETSKNAVQTSKGYLHNCEFKQFHGEGAGFIAVPEKNLNIYMNIKTPSYHDGIKSVGYSQINPEEIPSYVNKTNLGDFIKIYEEDSSPSWIALEPLDLVNELVPFFIEMTLKEKIEEENLLVISTYEDVLTHEWYADKKTEPFYDDEGVEVLPITQADQKSDAVSQVVKWKKNDFHYGELITIEYNPKLHPEKPQGINLENRTNVAGVQMIDPDNIPEHIDKDNYKEYIKVTYEPTQTLDGVTDITESDFSEIPEIFFASDEEPIDPVEPTDPEGETCNLGESAGNMTDIVGRKIKFGSSSNQCQRLSYADIRRRRAHILRNKLLD